MGDGGLKEGLYCRLFVLGASWFHLRGLEDVSIWLGVFGVFGNLVEEFKAI